MDTSRRIGARLKSYEIITLVFGFVCTGLVLFTPLSFSVKLAGLFFFKTIELTALVFAMSIVITGYRAFVEGRSRGFKNIAQWSVLHKLADPYWSLEYLLLTLRRGFTIFAVIYFFLHLKHVILFINSSNWDLFYWNLDKALHLGVQPNVWVMEKFGTNHNVAILADWLYIKYFSYMLIACFIFLMDTGGRRMAERFFFAYAFLWSVGGVGYLITPADGPCYAALINYSTPEGEREHMFRFPVIENVPNGYIASYGESKIWIAKIYQERLWMSRKRFLIDGKEPGMFYGIAAMPSLHVAMVGAIMFFLFALSPFLGALGAIYLAAIFFGSILLQWHYAVDGYVGLLMGYGSFFISGRVVK
ncbi:hypothetical protein MNBD_NITROSPINAE02-1323 [hydrothermal vent metagenome]|uniref:Inositolphosphotransferase Aur1/Ipt1 domain-containing protein n=1 Tax=hydrothermal vent metagenome TaxID=652676 RepID=A0A3B1BM04_9ZZZZ